MKKIITLIVYTIAFTIYLPAQSGMENPHQTDANIFGHVLDKQTGEHLPYVTLSLKGTTIGITTDATGHYFFRNLPIGSFTLEVSMIGYKTASREVDIFEDTTLELNFELETESYSLDAVVVSANRNETTRRTAPSLVSVVDMKTLDVTSSTTLADGLKFQPGVRIENNCQNCGTTQIRINGLEGPYSQILIDSRPVVGALAGVYALEQIPANMIERIEVIRGGGSALFGANAIGGTINVITREPIRNSGEFAHTLSAINGTASLENNTTFNASLVNDTRNAGIMLYGQHRARDGYDHDGDGFTELAQLKNRSFGFRSFIKTGVYSRLSLEYQNIHEFRRGGDRLDMQPFEAYITEQVEHYINGGSLKYDHFLNGGSNRLTLYSAAHHTDRNSYYGAGDPYNANLPEITPGMPQDQLDEVNDAIENNDLRLNAFGHTTELTYQLGGHYMHSFDHLFFMPSELLVGTEFMGSDLSDKSGYREAPIEQQANTMSGFLQNEWKTDRWGILLGGRLDKHNLLDHGIFSPRLNLRFNPNQDINIRLTYSEGFRAPQLFDEDLHVDIAGGEQIVRVLSDDLREERSHSLSGSIDFYHQIGRTQFNLLGELFYTRLNRPFAETRRGTEVIVENDEKGAHVYGLNLEGRMMFGTSFELQGGATLQRSEYAEARKWWEPESPEEEVLDSVEPTKKMMRTPNTYAYFVATFTPVSKFSATLSGNYTGSMLVPHEVGFGIPGQDSFSEVNITKESPSFFELNLRLAYDFNLYNDVTLQLNGGVKNIFNAYQNDFDTGPGRANTYIYGPGAPRTVFAGLKMTL